MFSDQVFSWGGTNGGRSPCLTHSFQGLTGGKAHPRLLVVDDETHARITTARMLRYEGFEVIEAASGKEALATLAANPDIRLAIIDVVMPEMPGTVLASLLPQVAPACGIILMTGYTRDQARLGSSFSAHPVLVKPFTTNQLIKQVVTLLEGGSH